MSKGQAVACAVCGRKAGRDCPALDEVTCNICCGARRGSKIDCPPECPHFPFGTAALDKLLRVEDSWLDKTLKYVLDRVGRDRFQHSVEKCALPWEEGDLALEGGFELAPLRHLSIGMGDDLESIGSIWKKEDWTGLNNDERYMAEYRRKALPGIIEIQKILDDKAVECVDLVDTERGRFIVLDRNTAKSAARFDRIAL